MTEKYNNSPVESQHNEIQRISVIRPGSVVQIQDAIPHRLVIRFAENDVGVRFSAFPIENYDKAYPILRPAHVLLPEQIKQVFEKWSFVKIWEALERDIYNTYDAQPSFIDMYHEEIWNYYTTDISYNLTIPSQNDQGFLNNSDL